LPLHLLKFGRLCLTLPLQVAGLQIGIHWVH
jgi:hypothetical protein